MMKPDLFTPQYGEHEYKMYLVTRDKLNGYHNAEIAKRNYISVRTVQRYLKRYREENK